MSLKTVKQLAKSLSIQDRIAKRAARTLLLALSMTTLLGALADGVGAQAATATGAATSAQDRQAKSVLQVVLPQILKAMKRPDIRAHARIQLGSNEAPVLDFNGNVALPFSSNIVIPFGDQNQSGPAGELAPVIQIDSANKVFRLQANRDPKSGHTQSNIGFYDMIAATRQSAPAVKQGSLAIHLKTNLAPILDLEISSIDFGLDREAAATGQNFGTLKVSGTCTARQSTVNFAANRVEMQPVKCGYTARYDFSDSSYKLDFDYDSSN